MTTPEFLTKPYSNEDQMTADFHRWVNNNYPELRGFYFHIANESATSSLMRIKLSAMGVLPGVPDFIFLTPLLFMELKMPDGTLSPNQRRLHERWLNAGISVTVAYSKGECVDFMQTFFGNPAW